MKKWCSCAIPSTGTTARPSSIKLTYRLLNSEAELASYRSGAIDLTVDKVPTRKNQKLQVEFSEEFRLFPKPAVSGYRLNTKTPPFNDVRVRQALNLVLNRKIIAQQLAIPEQYLAYNIVPNGLGGLKTYQPHWISWTFERRLQMAKKLLQEAGYGPSHPLRFTLLSKMNEFNKQLALIVRALWHAHLGVEVTLLNQEWMTFLDTIRTGHYQAADASVSSLDGEPYGLLSDYLSYSCRNNTGYSPTFDNLLDKALDSLYAAERYTLYHKAEAQLAEDVPLIPVIHPAAMHLVKPYIGGLSDRNTMNLFYTKDLYITQHPLAPQKTRQ